MSSDKGKTAISKKPLSSQLHDESVSMLARYMDKAYGTRKPFPVLANELRVFLLGDLPGGAGYFLRKTFYGGMFRMAGRGVIYGRGLILRHPGKISIGARVSIDDDVMLDASGAGEKGITLGDGVIVSRNCVIQGKTGPVMIGDRTDIGCNCIFSSVSGIEIGNSTLIAGHCYIGGGRYRSDRLDIPIMDQGSYSEGPVMIGEDVWLGAGVIVLDGVRIGRGTIIGAGSVVTREIPEYSVAVGVPARVIGTRGK
ncbi:MAG: Acetyltransferase (isoleucine patch superfamily)-like protein [Deltaproteobacteria bacterium]|nr:Acetyltransferase (isoleucine patch superfamily)-like protein [Deltaproteobacteria bacterium]